MNSSEIESLVDASLSGARSVYTGHVTDPAGYIVELLRRFNATRIAPTSESVLLERDVYGLGLSPGTRTVYFVNHSDPQSVFFDPETHSFGCAWGPELPNFRYVDLGFRSQDVLEVFSA
jgi:hypothetical protein